MALRDRIAMLIPGRSVDTITDMKTDRDPTARNTMTRCETTPSDSSESAGNRSAESGSEYDPESSPDNMVSVSGRETMHVTRVAPSAVQLKSNTARTGDYWVKTLFVTGFPNVASPGLLDRVCTHPSADIDVTIYADPRSLPRSLRQFQSAIKSLKVDYIEAQKHGSAMAPVIQRRIQEHEDVYSQLKKNSQRIFDVGVFLTIRGDSKNQVNSIVEKIRGELQRQRLTTKTAAYRQGDALITGSPIAKDTLGQSTPMLGQAAGALFPFASNTTIEESGVLYGYHAKTGAPVYIDRFCRENGHNVLMTGEVGSGKTYNTKCLLLRRLAKDRETDIVIIDPVGDFGSLADSLDAEHYVIGGTRTVNPLEIRPTPDFLLEKENISPFTEHISTKMDFFETFFEYIDAPLGDRRQVLERCLREAYHRKGITKNVGTHGNESPVISDVRAVLGDIAVEPTTVLTDDEYSAGELDKWQDLAQDLRLNFEPFTSAGQFSFLNGPTEVDLTGSQVIYLDLQQFGRGSDDALTGLVMQPMFDAVYERLKSATKTILAIDEAHYLVEAPGSVEWLKRITRHSRHLDLSLHFVTQELDDFYESDGAETFINQSSIKILHRQGNLNESHTDADVLDLTDRQADFVRNAIIGEENLGFSTAFLDIDDGGSYPICVTALPEEEEIIEDDDKDDTAYKKLDDIHHDSSFKEDADAATDGGKGDD